MHTSDYELIYLYRVWQSDIALEMLYEKYDVIIRKKLNSFKIREYHYEDFYQELLMTLHKAIMLYDQSYKKSFYRFSEMFFDRRLGKLLRHDVRNDRLIERLFDESTKDSYFYDDVLETFVSNKRLEVLNDINLSDLQREVLSEVLIKNKSVNDFAKDHNIDIKVVYNSVYLLRKKIKKAWEISL